jgi:EAL domain-containing protein (putative c-di-GMP-specific phosphodiesterase class I)
MAESTVTSLFGVDRRSVDLPRLVELAHRHLDLDLVFVDELTDHAFSLRAVAGENESFGIDRSSESSWHGAYSRLLLEGAIPNVITDTANDPRLAELPVTSSMEIGAFIGVPLLHSDGTLFGTLCGLDHDPDPTLGKRDVRFMTMLAELIADHLDERRERDLLTQQLTDLIEHETIDIAYQPIVDLVTGNVLGVEALSRFPAALPPPERLFADADGVGLGLELERLAIRQAWPSLEVIRPDQFVALNVSPNALLELARRAQERDNLPLRQLVVEITERSVVECYGDLRDVIDPLRAEGLRLAVDDAGAGWASLHHVIELRPDFVKIDRSLVDGVADDHARRVAISGFVLLSLDLDATLVAEGVERPEDLAQLRELGIDVAQGYLLGRPSTRPADLDRWIEGPVTLPAPELRQAILDRTRTPRESRSRGAGWLH